MKRLFYLLLFAGFIYKTFNWLNSELAIPFLIGSCLVSVYFIWRNPKYDDLKELDEAAEDLPRYDSIFENPTPEEGSGLNQISEEHQDMMDFSIREALKTIHPKKLLTPFLFVDTNGVRKTIVINESLEKSNAPVISLLKDINPDMALLVTEKTIDRKDSLLICAYSKSQPIVFKFVQSLHYIHDTACVMDDLKPMESKESNPIFDGIHKSVTELNEGTFTFLNPASGSDSKSVALKIDFPNLDRSLNKIEALTPSVITKACLNPEFDGIIKFYLTQHGDLIKDQVYEKKIKDFINRLKGNGHIRELIEVYRKSVDIKIIHPDEIAQI